MTPFAFGTWVPVGNFIASTIGADTDGPKTVLDHSISDEELSRAFEVTDAGLKQYEESLKSTTENKGVADGLPMQQPRVFLSKRDGVQSSTDCSVLTPLIARFSYSLTRYSVWYR
jgi:hypothetical protein